MRNENETECPPTSYPVSAGFIGTYFFVVTSFLGGPMAAIFLGGPTA